jgi:type II secretion system protein G
MKLRNRAFTLIELLIVVAIIAILAGIAVPNFLEAQTRSKVARVQADMRSLATAIESYGVDVGRYPYGQSLAVPTPYQKLRQLTTPVAYITSIPQDPFYQGGGLFSILYPNERADTYLYNTGVAEFGNGVAQTPELFQKWSLTGTGPDGQLQFAYYAFSPSFIRDKRYLIWVYDPTNGTVSSGDIFLRGGNNSENTPELAFN